MSSTKDEKDMSNRREFFHGVASSMAGATMLAAAAQLGVPILNAAQGGEAKPKEAVSTFFRNPPPWPKGTDGHIYDHLYSTKLKENSLLPDIIPGPQAYFRGNSDLPGAKINMGWQIFTKPIKLEMESHHHSVDEYQFYLGSTFPDLVGSFDAEIEVFIGPKYERHIINKATVLYLPAGLEHNPCDFRKVGKPVFFSSLHMAPFCNGVYQTMGYRTFVSARKID
ncbi:MAG: hypothetical protein ABSC60_16600 [Acidobacteriota bacterium]|jgi:hypothetical protein